MLSPSSLRLWCLLLYAEAQGNGSPDPDHKATGPLILIVLSIRDEPVEIGGCEG